MAKQSGLGDNFLIDGIDLSNDVGSLARIAGGNSPLVVTGIDKSGYERIGGKRDGAIELMTFRNPAAGKEFDTLSTRPTTDRIAMYLRGTTLGNPGACMVCKQVNYDPTRAQDGSYTNSIQTLANGFGLEWGRQLTAGLRADTGATNGTGVDFTTSSAFGLQAYVELKAFTGTSVTIKIQESSDNAVGDPYADVTGGSFGALSAVGAARIATATNLSVERWLRVVTTGTFSVATFAVVVVRNEVTPAF